MPYFKFEVLDNYPERVDKNIIRVIEVREIEDYSVYRGVRFLWFDKNLYGKQQPEFQKENENYLKYF